MKKLRNTIVYALTAGVFLAVGFFGMFAIMPQMASAIDDVAAPIVNTSALLVEQESVYSQIYRTVSPSVVAISVQGRRSENAQWTPISSGSGFVVDMDGHIVTNNHVIDGADNIELLIGEGAEARLEITMFDGTITEAQIVGTDPDSDLAVIQIAVPQDRLHPVSFASSDELVEGQIVFALGNPFSNDWTLTTGIISALNRSIPSLDRFQTGGVIQTDAAINPGNSGGPLVNINGQVIGVNSQINSESGSNSGIGFAVPSNLVIRVADSIIETGDMQYSYLGITSTAINLSIIEAYNLPNNIRGVVINQVFSDTPASNAGLESASNTSLDIITAINGQPIADFDELIGYLSIHTAPNDTVNFTIYRGGQIFQVPVTLAPRP